MTEKQDPFVNSEEINEPAREEISLSSEGTQKYTDDELLFSLKTLAVDLNRSPTVSDVRNLAEKMPDVATFERRFGSWNKALRAAELEGAYDKSDETLLRQLAELSMRLGGRAPTKREVDLDPSVASSGTYTNRFGKFSLAVGLAMKLNSSESDKLIDD